MDQGFPPPPGYGPPPAPGAPRVAPTKKPVRPGRRLLSRQVVFALVFALVAGVLLLTITSGGKGDQVWVVRASEPIPALSPVSAEQLEYVQLSESVVEEGAVSADSEEAIRKEVARILENARTRYPIARNQQLREAYLTREVSIGALASDERLISVEATPAAAVAATLKPGDRVDVIGYDSQSNIAGVVATDVTIVSVSVSNTGFTSAATEQTNSEGRERSPNELLPGDPIPGTYVLRVRTFEVAPITVAAGGGEVFLAYRAPNARSDVSVPMSVIEAICGRGLAASDPQPDDAGTANDTSGRVTLTQPVPLVSPETVTQLPETCRAVFATSGQVPAGPEPVPVQE